MDSRALKISSFSRELKLLLIITSDCFLALTCWVVFGPPMATMIASEFSTGFLEIIRSSIISVAVPIFLSISYLYYQGFYHSMIKFFDSKNSIFEVLLL